MKKKIAVLAAGGLGDALLMMIAAHQLAKNGDDVTLFHDSYPQFSALFDTEVRFRKYPKDVGYFKEYDLVILENDHSARAYALFAHKTAMKELFVIFPKPSRVNIENSYLFDPNLSFVANLKLALKRYIDTPTSENGFIQLDHYRRYPNRVVIHPASGETKRNWDLNKYLSVATILKKRGFDPVFTVSPQDAKLFSEIEKKGHTIITFESLKALAQYYRESGYFIGNDSGPGHLASLVGLPTLTISSNPKHVRKWRPGWHTNKIATIPFALPNFKGIGLAIRDHYWQPFVSVKRVIRLFDEIQMEEE